jgi:hypothetical protein
MATMTVDRGTGAREFVVPFSAPPGGFFATAPAELVISVGRTPIEPRKVAVRYFPGQLEFQLRLFELVKGTPFEPMGPEFSMGAATADPVVTFEANAGIVRRLPSKLDDLASLEGFLAANPRILMPESYALAAIELRRKPTGS